MTRRFGISAFLVVLYLTVCIVLHLTGSALPPEEILENMKRVLHLCGEKSIRKGIIYRSESAKQKASVFDFYKLSEFLASLQLSRFRVALVFPRESKDDEIDFFETASTNRGVNIRRFATYEEAQDWMIVEGKT